MFGSIIRNTVFTYSSSTLKYPREYETAYDFDENIQLPTYLGAFILNEENWKMESLYRPSAFSPQAIARYFICQSNTSEWANTSRTLAISGPGRHVINQTGPNHNQSHNIIKLIWMWSVIDVESYELVCYEQSVMKGSAINASAIKAVCY